MADENLLVKALFEVFGVDNSEDLCQITVDDSGLLVSIAEASYFLDRNAYDRLVEWEDEDSLKNALRQEVQVNEHGEGDDKAEKLSSEEEEQILNEENTNGENYTENPTNFSCFKLNFLGGINGSI